MEGLIASIPYIVEGVGMTVSLTLLGLLLGLSAGLPLALVRVYGRRPTAALVGGYVHTIRSLPLLVIIFIFYFVVARHLNLPPYLAASLALAVRSAAYQAELFRGAIQSIGRGQMMAARSLGMTHGQAILFVILPQTVRLAIPAWSNEAAIVLKDSSLAYAVGVLELLRRTEYVSARTTEHFWAFMVAGAMYFALTFATNRSLGLLELRLRLPTGS